MRARLTNLPRPSDWAVARQRARPHSETWPERRRHVVKRAAAITAAVHPRALDAQPVAARRAFRIQTLHRPTGQILHFRWPRKNHSPDGVRESRRRRSSPYGPSNWRDCGAEALGSQEKYTQLVVVGFQICGKCQIRTDLACQRRCLFNESLAGTGEACLR
jgi:hypothetical protein